jgi:hypothetical protein
MPTSCSVDLCASTPDSSVPAGHSKLTSKNIAQNVRSILPLRKQSDLKTDKHRIISDANAKILAPLPERKLTGGPTNAVAADPPLTED